ncbi:serine/threonine protein kinase [Gigaspora margarita]|uniref:Serine/threonine protein kinase n=1 Tax=Gigaspora margarita TaxID=4874 RepID=A0A8H4ARW3_GIGMA|nr:serine/threonine protein kinase [Gigaspora margarita]
MNKQYHKESLALKIYHGMKKIIKKKPTCQTSGCYNTCAGRKDVYCTGCIEYPPNVQNTYIPPVTVNQTPLSPPTTAAVQPIETIKLTTSPSPKLTKVPSNSVIKKTEMTLLETNHSEYIKIQKFFRKGLPNNIIHGIFKLNMPTDLVKAHNTKFCNFGCGVCGIAQNGNSISLSRDRKLWFSNNSSISLGYCNGFGGTGEKGMFVIDFITNSPGQIFTLGSEAATLPKYLIIFQ